MDYLKEFAAFLDSAEADLAEDSQEVYLRETAELLRFAIAQRPEGFTAKLVEDHLAALRAKGIKPRTLNKKRMAIRAFLKFMVRRGLMEPNILALIAPIRQHPRNLTALTPEEVAKMLVAIKGQCALRDRAIVLLFYSCGLRVSELCGLNIDQLSPTNNVIRVRGKRSKERLVPMTRECHEAIQEYARRWRTHHAAPRERALFVTLDGGRVVRRVVTYMLYRLAERARVRHASSHTMRRSCATGLLNGGMPIEQVSEFLGHASVRETQPYLGVSQEALNQTYHKYFRAVTEGPQ